jgi:hypothetical protein
MIRFCCLCVAILAFLQLADFTSECYSRSRSYALLNSLRSVPNNNMAHETMAENMQQRTVTCLLKGRIVKPVETAVSRATPVARQHLAKTEKTQ